MGRGAFVGVYGVTMVILGVVLSLVGMVLLPALYLMPAVFQLAFAFNARPAKTRLSRWVWVFMAAFVLAMAGLPFLLR